MDAPPEHSITKESVSKWLDEAKAARKKAEADRKKKAKADLDAWSAETQAEADDEVYAFHARLKRLIRIVLDRALNDTNRRMDLNTKVTIIEKIRLNILTDGYGDLYDRNDADLSRVIRGYTNDVLRGLRGNQFIGAKLGLLASVQRKINTLESASAMLDQDLQTLRNRQAKLRMNE